MSKIRAALLSSLWALIIFFGKPRLIESLGSLTLVPSLVLIVLLAAFFVIPCSVLLMSLFFGD